MRNTPSRALGTVAALLASVWALFLLPPQLQEWSGDDVPAWLGTLGQWPVYDALRQWLLSIGQGDFYLWFGAPAAFSFVLVWFATGPALAALGTGGRILGATLLLGGLVTLLSYLNTDENAPLHMLWGAEALALLAIGVAGIVVAVVAPRGRGIPTWERVLLGSTLLVIAGTTLVFTYYPHGSLIGLGLEAAALAAWAPRFDDATDTASAQDLSRV